MSAPILVATDLVPDAVLVKKLLEDEFAEVHTSTESASAVADFERQRPAVLVLAFNALEKAERYCLRLYRLGGEAYRRPYRTILFCTKDEIRRAYELCRDGLFDDYVLFWPLTHDALRLPMAVHHALRGLAARGADQPSAVQFAAQARRMKDLESVLDLRLAQGGQHLAEAGRVMEQAEQDIGTTLDGFARQLQVAPPAAVEDLAREIDRLGKEDIRQRFRGAAEAVEPLRQWSHDFRQDCEPYLESARALNALAERVRPTLLVVDDDPFQRKLAGGLLGADHHLVFAASGREALNLLRGMRPDLILMDVVMPDMDGLEVTRQIKAVPRLADVPVLMVTGKSEKNVVVDGIRVGATDFVVKPLVREVLLAKVARALQGGAGQAARTAGPPGP